MQSDRLSTNLTNEQLEGIRAHELEFKRLVKLVHEKYERIKQESIRKAQERESPKAKKQAR